jgi:isocitrate lyase
MNRWDGIKRPYSYEEVERLRDGWGEDHTVARKASEKLWKLLIAEPHVKAMGAMSGNQAMQMTRGGLKSIYVSGWQCAADANLAGEMYPDQSLYPADSVPALVKRINNALRRCAQIERSEGNMNAGDRWLCPIMADAEAGFGGALNCYELMKAMIRAGAAGVHFEDQLASEKKCGHLGGKVLIPTREFITKLTAARLAADVMGVPTVIVARTDADAAKLITSDVDERDRQFLTGERTEEGFYRLKGTGMERCIARGLAYCPYADMIWMETGHPDLDQAREFAEAIHKEYPGKPLMYNCSPSFNWKAKLDADTIAKFQRELGEMGYKFVFVTLAGFHQLNHGMYELARAYKDEGMAAYSKLQEAEFASEENGYSAVKHQREVGTKYFDKVKNTISSGSSTTAMEGSTEVEQFH